MLSVQAQKLRHPIVCYGAKPLKNFFLLHGADPHPGQILTDRQFEKLY